SLVRRQLGDAIGYVAFVCFWLSWEHLHLRWELSWPWLTLGNAFAQQPNWVQWYEFTGVPGGGIWIMVANILILYGIKNYPVIQYRFWFYAAVFILIPIGVSYIRLSKYNHLTDAHHEVAIIQPNYEPHYEKFVIDRDIQLQKCLRLAQSCLTPTTEYLVFPETTFEGVLRNNIRESEPIRALQLFAKQYPNLNIVSGVDAYKVYNTNEPLGKAARYSDRRDVYWESYNAAVQLSPNDSISFYLKSRLVPGPEIIPYRTLFFFIEPLVDKLGGSFAGLGTQAQRSVFTYEGKKIAPVICYESIYGEYITEYIRAGAQAIFIMTNDGWWDDTAGYLQHLKFGALRAIETRRYIARAANTGTSSVILPTGEITQSTAYGSDAAFIGKIGLRNEQTFYVQYGDYLSRIAIFFTILIFGIGLSTFIRVRRRAT
ncbi:MAG: apolipoprotein N-acyltransferase, partial [Saprospiraceae bacterium]